MYALVLAVIGAFVVAFLNKKGDEAIVRLKLKATDRAVAFDGDLALTEEIYTAARRARLDPEYEMQCMRETIIYPLCVILPPGHKTGQEKKLCSLKDGWSHRDGCMCAECQVERLPPEERTNIFVEENIYGEVYPVAHARSCVCDKCRLKSGIDAEKALELSLMRSSSTTSRLATGVSERSNALQACSSETNLSRWN